MTGATPQRTRRAAMQIDDVDHQITAALRVLRDRLKPADDTEEDAAMCTLEMFAVIALKLMRASNPSKVRDIARTEEIRARLDGKSECLGTLTKAAA